jgi:hypothetical protein
VQHGDTLLAVPTRHPRQMITLTPERAALLNEIAGLEGQRPDLGALVDEGAAARIQRLARTTTAAHAARGRVADQIRRRALDQDPEAADRVKRLGVEP